MANFHGNFIFPYKISSSHSKLRLNRSSIQLENIVKQLERHFFSFIQGAAPEMLIVFEFKKKSLVTYLQDILVESPANEDSPLNENSVRKMQQIAEAFFDTIDDVNMNSAKDLKSIISVLDASCKRNHIR